jgi:hypothetical protein
MKNSEANRAPQPAPKRQETAPFQERYAAPPRPPRRPVELSVAPSQHMAQHEAVPEVPPEDPLDFVKEVAAIDQQERIERPTVETIRNSVRQRLVARPELLDLLDAPESIFQEALTLVSSSTKHGPDMDSIFDMAIVVAGRNQIKIINKHYYTRRKNVITDDEKAKYRKIITQL